MLSLTLKYDNDSIKSVWKWEIDIIFQMLIGKSVTHFNEINKCSFDFLNQFNTSKISWIIDWPWSNYVCVCVCECASVSRSVIDSTNWYMGRKNKYCLEIWILAWRSHGKTIELFSEIFVGTLSRVIVSITHWGRYRVAAILQMTHLDEFSCMKIGVLAPGKCSGKFKSIIFKCITQKSSLDTHCEIGLRWMLENLTNDKSTLLQVMAWCRQAPSHYLSPC